MTAIETGVEVTARDPQDSMRIKFEGVSFAHGSVLPVVSSFVNLLILGAFKLAVVIKVNEETNVALI